MTSDDEPEQPSSIPNEPMIKSINKPPQVVIPPKIPPPPPSKPVEPKGGK